MTNEVIISLGKFSKFHIEQIYMKYKSMKDTIFRNGEVPSFYLIAG